MSNFATPFPKHCASLPVAYQESTWRNVALEVFPAFRPLFLSRRYCFFVHAPSGYYLGANGCPFHFVFRRAHLPPLSMSLTPFYCVAGNLFPRRYPFCENAEFTPLGFLAPLSNLPRPAHRGHSEEVYGTREIVPALISPGDARFQVNKVSSPEY